MAMEKYTEGTLKDYIQKQGKSDFIKESSEVLQPLSCLEKF